MKLLDRSCIWSKRNILLEGKLSFQKHDKKDVTSRNSYNLYVFHVLAIPQISIIGQLQL